MFLQLIDRNLGKEFDFSLYFNNNFNQQVVWMYKTGFYMCNPYQYFQTTCRKYIFESSLHFDKKTDPTSWGLDILALFVTVWIFSVKLYDIFFLHGSVSLYLLSLQKLIKSLLPQANIYFVDVIIKFRRNRQCHLSFELVYHS